MTKELIEQLAKEAGADIGTWDKSGNGGLLISFTSEQLEAFAKAYQAQTQQEAAKIKPIASVIFNETEEYTMLPIGRAIFHLQPNVEHSLFLSPQPDKTAALEARVAELEAALHKIQRGNSKPFPDPNVHGWESFGRAAMALATDYKFIAINALKAGDVQQAAMQASSDSGG